MSIFWNARARQPQLWVYPFFICLTVLLFAGIYFFGSRLADQKESAPIKIEAPAK